MKKTKKLIAVVLAMVMMLSTASVAFAGAECEHEFNTETLVRITEEEDAYFTCKKCGKDVTVKPADFSEYFEIEGRIYALENIGYFDEEAHEKVWNYYYELYDRSREELNEILKVDITYVTELTEYEQDVVDAVVDILEAVIEETERFAEEQGLTPLFDMKDYYIAYIKAYNYYPLLYHKTVGELFAEMPEEKYSETLAMIEEAYAVLKEYDDIEDPEDFSANDISKINGAFAKYAYVYGSVANCIAGEHKCEAVKDNGNGKHISTCSFCGCSYGEQEHIWGEYTENENADPCHNKDTETAKCTLCTAENTIVIEDSRGTHINEDGDDFCDRCGERVVERCSFCDEVAHEGYLKYVCMLRTLIKLIVNLFKTVNN